MSRPSHDFSRPLRFGLAAVTGTVLLLVCLLWANTTLGPGAARANTSHAGWPKITGVSLQNKSDQSRPMDLRVGHDVFDETDSTYACDGKQKSTTCFPSDWWHCKSESGELTTPKSLPNTHDLAAVADQICHGGSKLVVIVGEDTGHNLLMGGHGNNEIHAGPDGDVIWGDYKPSGDPETQIDHLYGGPGDDIIYAAHGTNYVYTGGGKDLVHATYGRGVIHCESAQVTVDISHKARPHYKLPGCHHIKYD